MRFCLAGASGFLGSALRTRLLAGGHEVTSLVRREPQSAEESQWDPAEGRIDTTVIEGADVVVNLSGAPIARWPWTESYKRTLMSSRVDSTRTIAHAVAASAEPPVLLSGSGQNAYGSDRGAEELDESSSHGSGTLADVVEEWEAATFEAAEAGARVCHLRTSVVLDRSGGSLKLIALPFRLGVGGRIGSGQQYFSVISRNDWIRSVEFLATDEHASGAYNLTAPQTPTNAEFSKALASHLHRPSAIPVPSFAVKLALGELAGELLGSLRVSPTRLLEAGFEFEQPDLDSMLDEALRG